MSAQVNPAFVTIDDEDLKGRHQEPVFSPPPPQSGSNDAAIDYSKARKLPQVYAAIAAALGAYILGNCYGWSSSVQIQLTRNATVEDDPESVWYLKLTDEELSWASSLINIGGLVGSVFGGLLMDRFGRRATLLAMSAPYIIGWLLVTLAIYPSMLYIGRIICGLAAGVCTAAVPSYIGEISTPNLRGLVGVFFSFNICFGVFITSLLVWMDWRYASTFTTLQPLLFLLAMSFVPETPYYLVKKGRFAQAEKSLEWLRGADFPITVELDQIKRKVELDSTLASSVTDILQPWAYKPVLIGIAVHILQQFAGLGPAVFYSVEIFRQADSSIDPAICSVLLKLVQLLMEIPTMFLVEHLGRRPLFIASELMTCLSVFVIGGYFYILNNDPVTAVTLGWLPLTALIFFIAFLSAGIQPLAWVVSNEVLPARFRGPGSSIAAFTNWLSMFIATKTFLDMQNSLTTAGTFWVYGCFCFVGMLFALFLMPETKGKTAAEIDELFEGSSRPPLGKKNKKVVLDHSTALPRANYVKTEA